MIGDPNTDLAIAIGASFAAILLTWLATAKMRADAVRPRRCRLSVAEFEVEADSVPEIDRLAALAQRMRANVDLEKTP